MSDLISRQALIDAVEEVTWYHQNQNGKMVQGANSAEHQAWYKAEDIYTAIESVPSADARPVIRCKDCNSAECSGVMIYCLTHGCYMRDNDFCNYGERKDGDHHED